MNSSVSNAVWVKLRVLQNVRTNQVGLKCGNSPEWFSLGRTPLVCAETCLKETETSVAETASFIRKC